MSCDEWYKDQVEKAIAKLTHKLVTPRIHEASRIFATTAKLCDSLGLSPCPPSASDIILEKILYKLSRAQQGYQVDDSLLDIAGYAILGLVHREFIRKDPEDTDEGYSF